MESLQIYLRFKDFGLGDPEKLCWDDLYEFSVDTTKFYYRTFLLMAQNCDQA